MGSQQQSTFMCLIFLFVIVVTLWFTFFDVGIPTESTCYEECAIQSWGVFSYASSRHANEQLCKRRCDYIEDDAITWKPWSSLPKM
jgi:hypothetical protein